MSLSSDAVQSVTSSWALVTSNHLEELFLDSFYKFLFNTYPQVKHYFPADRNKLNLKLLETLNIAINSLDYIDDLEDELKELGRFHENLNITADQYSTVVDSSLYALNAVIDKELSSFDKQCWVEAFELISEKMISGYSNNSN